MPVSFTFNFLFAINISSLCSKVRRIFPVCSLSLKCHPQHCRTCRCRETPRENDDPVACPAVRCLKACPAGYETDSRGCETCRCRGERPRPDRPVPGEEMLRSCAFNVKRRSSASTSLALRSNNTQHHLTFRPPPAGRCSLPQETGPCRAAFRRYFFNSETQTCETFIFGGCGGNRNNFRSLRHCQRAC